MNQKKIIIYFSIVASLLITLPFANRIYNSSVFYPVKSAFCTWASDTRIINSNDGLSEIQQKNIQEHLLPGDILISQMNMSVSNICIPGFWTHAAVYIGTPKKRKSFFKNDPDFLNWAEQQGFTNNSFEQFIVSKNQNNTLPLQEENEQVIIEALCEGVVLSTFEDFALKDAIAILRPRIPKTEIANAIQAAYTFLDTPYDFDFDFKTDTAIACTELIYRMYGDVNIIPINRHLGKTFTTCNEIVRHFDETYGTSSQKFDLVMVYIEDKIVFTIDNLAINDFRSSWKRSMWDF